MSIHVKERSNSSERRGPSAPAPSENAILSQSGVSTTTLRGGFWVMELKTAKKNLVLAALVLARVGSSRWPFFGNFLVWFCHLGHRNELSGPRFRPKQSPLGANLVKNNHLVTRNALGCASQSFPLILDPRGTPFHPWSTPSG